jgi:hypothetical protein
LYESVKRENKGRRYIKEGMDLWPEKVNNITFQYFFWMKEYIKGGIFGDFDRMEDVICDRNNGNEGGNSILSIPGYSKHNSEDWWRGTGSEQTE